MEIITGYTGKKHVTSEQDRDINIGIVGGKSYVLCTGMQMEAEVSTNNEIKIRDGVVMHQGCAASVKKNTYDSVTIISGSQGMKRIDRIVARYQRDKDTNTESLDWVVIQGIPAENDPAVPEYVIGDIQAGDYVADMPMYQVVIDGLNIVEVKKEFETTIDIATVKKELTELNGNMTWKEIPVSITCTESGKDYTKNYSQLIGAREVYICNDSGARHLHFLNFGNQTTVQTSEYFSAKLGGIGGYDHFEYGVMNFVTGDITVRQYRDSMTETVTFTHIYYR